MGKTLGDLNSGDRFGQYAVFRGGELDDFEAILYRFVLGTVNGPLSWLVVVGKVSDFEYAAH